MTKTKINRRMVDPITFQERISVQYSPHLEDNIVDESMSYAPPRTKLIYRPQVPPLVNTTNSATLSPLPPPPPPPPPPESPPPHSSDDDGDDASVTRSTSNEQYRPPTPPKARDASANSPRNTSKKSIIERLSPLRKNKKLEMSLSKITEDMSLGSDSSMSVEAIAAALQKSPVRSSPTTNNKLKPSVGMKGKKLVRFADEVEENEISRLRNSMIAELFYASEDLANFRYEVCMLYLHVYSYNIKYILL